MSKAENPNQGKEIEIISIDQREIELLEKNRKINLQKLFTPEGMDLMIAEIQKEVADFSADISTKEGRAKIISMAAKVAKCKSPIKNLASELKEESRKLIDGVNAQWNRYETAMDELRDKIRKPVDEIEEKEKAILEARQYRLGAIKFARTDLDFIAGNVANSYEEAIKKVKDLLEYDWGDFAFAAETEANLSIKTLEEKADAARERAKEQAELAQLRKEAAERAQKDHEEKIAREAAEKAKREAEEAAERERKAAIEREAKIEADKKAAEERAKEAKKRELMALRREDLFKIGMKYSANEQCFYFDDVRMSIDCIEHSLETEWTNEVELASLLISKRKKHLSEIAEKKAKEDAEKAALEAVEKERLRVAEEKRVADLAAEKLAADKLHCTAVKNEALADIFAIILDQNQARLVVEAIASGDVAHVQINY